MKRMVLLVLLAALLLSGCRPGQDETEPTPTQTEPSQSEMTEPSEDPTESQPVSENTYMYAGAQTYLLEPVANFSWEREYAPEFVMIHSTSAVVNHRDDPYNIEHIRDIFEEYEVSIHYIIDRDGTVYCFVPEDRVAWHAGKGQFAGDEKYTNKMNYYAIGIELMAMGSQHDMALYLTQQEYQALDQSLIGFTDAQYEALAGLVADLCGRYEIPKDRNHIIGHQEYAPDKRDPGELFDWDRLMKAIG